MKRRKFIKQGLAGTAALSSFQSLGSVGEDQEVNNSVSTSLISQKEIIRIAVVQQDGNPGQVKANRKKALKRIEEALNANADVILFHEEMLVGYVENLHELAEPVNGPTSLAFQKILKGTKAKVIYGLTEKDNTDFYISAPVVTEDGVIANYRKTHLWWKADGLRHEPSFYKTGNKLVTFDLMGHKCGIMICYDGDFPEVTRAYAKKGCSMLFWMNNRESRGYKEVKHLAQRNSIIIPTACCSGYNEIGRLCRGGSNITGANGELLEEIWDKEGVIIADVNPGAALLQRAKNPFFKGMRPDLY